MTSGRPVVAITQARIGSSRLPGKVLLPVAGEPLLWWHLTRLRQARSLDGIVVATTEEPEAAEIVAIADRLGIPSYRGALDDVLARFEGAAREAGAATVVRVTSDCPLIDPALIDETVTAYLSAGACDYMSLDVSRYPRGLDCEVFGYSALNAAFERAADPSDREHVTPYVRRHAANAIYRAPSVPVAPHRWCVDTPADLELVRHVLEHFGAPVFGWRDVAALVEGRPDWYALNAHIAQKS